MSGEGKALVLLAVILVATMASLGVVIYRNSQLEGEISTLRNQVETLKTELHGLALQPSVENQTVVLYGNLTFSDIYAKARNSVVVVYGYITKTVITFFGPSVVYEKVQGSGFVINFNGSYYVVTNNHVVENVQNITLVFSDGEAFEAKVVGTDPYSDLAVLRPYVPEQKLRPLNITPSSSLKVGDVVLALGNPVGLQGSLTEGVVSQLGRSIRTEATGGYLIPDVIQFDAPINPGNSGGPLLNVKGEVVGITTAIIGGAQGIGFAIPSDTILRELPYLVSKGYYDQHPWLGIRGVDMSYEIARAMKVNVTYGWLIVSVISGGPADQAGLKGGDRQVVIAGERMIVGGDIIVGADGHRIRNSDDLTTYLERNYRPGDRVTLQIIRDGQPMQIEVTLGKRPPPG